LVISILYKFVKLLFLFANLLTFLQLSELSLEQFSFSVAVFTTWRNCCWCEEVGSI